MGLKKLYKSFWYTQNFSRKQILHAHQNNLMAQMQWIQANLSGISASSILPRTNLSPSPPFSQGLLDDE